MKNSFLLIDCQNDFCHPDGSLFVPGADNDVSRLSKYIESNHKDIDNIALTLDSHYVMDISHPKYWVDFEGNHPAPFTQISKKEAKGRKFMVNVPDFESTWDNEKIRDEKQKMAVEYLDNLQSLKRFKHTIWPEHCIVGSWGHGVATELMDSIIEWSRYHGRDYQAFQKGLYQHTEHFGAFQAEVPDAQVPETTILASQGFLGHLDRFEKVYICGEAKSHCVANTVRQLCEFVEHMDLPDIADRYVIVEDVMSPVPGFENLGDDIFDKARELGFKFVKLDDIEL